MADNTGFNYESGDGSGYQHANEYESEEEQDRQQRSSNDQNTLEENNDTEDHTMCSDSDVEEDCFERDDDYEDGEEEDEDDDMALNPSMKIWRCLRDKCSPSIPVYSSSSRMTCSQRCARPTTPP